MPVAHLPDRAVLRVSGAESRTFLDRLVTCDLDRIADGGGRFGALLTPQGKIIADFLILAVPGTDEPAYALDTARACAADLLKRLGLYRLRAKVTIAEDPSAAILAGWGDTAPPTGAGHVAMSDPRLPALGWRALVPRDGLLDAGSPDDGEAAYHAHRIRQGVPEVGRDAAFGDAFPHETLMDQLAGVDFDKGCYIGQEVVSRMQHRGTARTRIVRLSYEDAAPALAGREIMAGGRVIGTTATAADDRGLAMIRIDRAADALAAGAPILADGHTVRFAKPDWVRFAYPDERIAAPAA